MVSGTVFNIQKFCIHDGDGIRTCVFLKGCPLNCIWCHNPESRNKAPVCSYDESKCSSCAHCLAVCSARSITNNKIVFDRNKCIKCGQCINVCLADANEIIGQSMSAAEVMNEVLKDKMFYDTSGGGVTVTGGEPSFQPEFTLELLKLSKEAGISIAVETCGYGSKDFYKKAAELGTTFLYDIKCIDPIRHKILTGSDNSQIISNLNFLMDSKADTIIRLPMIPGCNDSDEDIALLSDFLIKHMGLYRYAELMPYHSLGVGKAKKIGENVTYFHENASDAEISRWCSMFDSYGVDVRVSK